MSEAEFTERQKKWFATVRANLERQTGKSIEEWVEIAKTCPHTAPRARSRWLKEEHGVGANHAAVILSQTSTGDSPSWDDPQALRLQGLSRPLQRLARFGDGLRRPFQPAETVEQGTMLRRVRQRAIVVLAMDLDDRGTDHAQDLDGNRLVVDEGAGAPIGILHTAQDEISVGVDLLRLGELARGMVERKVEDGADLPLRLAMAHERAVAAPAQRQRETVEQDRLARARLARENAQALMEAEIEPVDQNDVTDRELRQHRRSARFAEPAGLPEARHTSLVSGCRTRGCRRPCAGSR